MTREAYLNEMDALRDHMIKMEAKAFSIALRIIQGYFPCVEETPHTYYTSNGDVVRMRPDYEPQSAEYGDFYEVNLRTGSVIFLGADLQRMRDAAAINPSAYDVLHRGNTVVFIVWRGREAAVLRFDADTGEKTGKIAFRNIESDASGEFCKIGRQTVYRGEARTRVRKQ